MPHTHWTIVRASIDADITAGRLQPGQRLPTEPELCQLYQTGRHSVRRAIAALAMEGKVRVQQGSGTYVETPELINYTIGRRPRLRQSFREQGLAPGGTRLGSFEIAADQSVARALGIAEGENVLRSDKLTTADGVPVAFGSIFHPIRLFPGLSKRREQFESLTETYKSYGITDYVRADTTVHTRRSTPEEAHALAQHPDMPVLIVRAVDTLLDGTPISFAHVAWAGARVRFTFDVQPVETPVEAMRRTDA